MKNENYKTYILSRVLSNSVKRENGCIEYAGGNLKHPYGLVSITIEGRRKSVPAHRALFMAWNNCLDLPSNIHVRHKCDNPCCVNIEHLIAGTPKDNAHDCTERGRRAKTYKKHTRQRVISDDTVRLIRNESPLIKQIIIAKKYNISVGYVSRIRTRKAKQLVV